jgi:hypothetical protein
MWANFTSHMAYVLDIFSGAHIAQNQDSVNWSGLGLRVCHVYGKTRGFRVTGFAGMGTVPNLAYPRITAYPCHSVTGLLRVFSSGLPVRVKIIIILKNLQKKKFSQWK